MAEGYIASHAGRTWRMMAFKFSVTARSRIIRNSAFCCSTGKPGLDGQSMLPTVATQAPRNSRKGGGGVALLDGA